MSYLTELCGVLYNIFESANLYQCEEEMWLRRIQLTALLLVLLQNTDLLESLHDLAINRA